MLIWNKQNNGFNKKKTISWILNRYYYDNGDAKVQRNFAISFGLTSKIATKYEVTCKPNALYEEHNLLSGENTEPKSKSIFRIPWKTGINFIFFPIKLKLQISWNK